MKNIKLNDITIRECENAGYSLSFKEKVEMAKIMDKLNYSVIELPMLTDKKADELLVKTIANTVKNSSVAIPVGFTKAEVMRAWDCVSKAKAPRLIVAVPTSPVQMEYICKMKGPKILEMITNLVTEAKQICAEVEFSALDATRAEMEFLTAAIKAAIGAGATKITLCDTAGVMLASDAGQFVADVIKAVPEIEGCGLAVEISNELDMSTACAFAAVAAGADEIKTTINGKGFPQIENVVKVLTKKGETIDVETSIVKTELSRAVMQMNRMSGQRSDNAATTVKYDSAADMTMTFDSKDDINVITDACRKIGYDLSEEDAANVYEAFTRVAAKKEKVTAKELEAIIASSALQVPATYKLVSYVTNSGNIISATANIVLQKEDANLSGISTGDGPIDAAFKAIEQILGHHYELDDFQIQAVTEGREATGQAIVKLRANGTLFSGTGISTDIIGASVRAYINAVNKIVYTEK